MARSLNPRIWLRDWLNKPTPEEQADLDKSVEACRVLAEVAMRHRYGGRTPGDSTGGGAGDGPDPDAPTGHRPTCGSDGDAATCSCRTTRWVASDPGAPL